ncbi:MAG: septum formation family protein [Arthrobacter sp.]|uniref:septum formation family protein n=1 Tax=Arthrobacter sp. TaxID=1667 RepID=UPI00346C9E43
MADAETMKVGDCLDEPDEEELQSFQTRPCSDPRQLEVCQAFPIEQGSFPAGDAAWESLTGACLPPFGEITGTTREDSSLESHPVTPTRESWAFGHRTVSCLVGQPTPESVAGSLPGKG